VPLAPVKTQHAVKNKNRGRDPKKGKLYTKITKGRDLKRSIENVCHDRYDQAWRELCSLLFDLRFENQSD
jgi:hypothetical protein